MWNRYLYYLVQFREIIFFSMTAMAVLTLILLTLLKRFGFGKRKNLAVVTLFFNMKPRHMLYLGVNCLLLCFPPAVMLFSREMQIAYLCYLLVLSVIAGFAALKPLELLRLLAGSILVYTALFIVDMLKSYIFNMLFDVRIAVIAALLCIFILFFDVYFFLSALKYIARDVSEARETCQENQREETEQEL